MDSETYCVLDLGDRLVLFTGTLAECEQVQEEGYGGLVVVEASRVDDYLRPTYHLSDFPNIG